jgi:hypothetical protein
MASCRSSANGLRCAPRGSCRKTSRASLFDSASADVAKPRASRQSGRGRALARRRTWPPPRRTA